MPAFVEEKWQRNSKNMDEQEKVITCMEGAVTGKTRN